jgi:glycosyltransferase involved in cell wall biosynthesis
VLPFAGLSGGARVIAIYGEKLRQRGHEVTVVSTPPPEVPLKRRLKSFIKGQGWPRSLKEPSHLDSTSIDHRVIDRFRAIVDEDVPDADVVVATWWMTAEWVADLSPSKGAKAYFIQSYVPDHPRGEREKATWRLPLHKITISQWLKDVSETTFGDRKISIVPNSVSFDQFSAPPRRKQDRATVGLLYSTAWVKGVDVSLKALAEVQKRIDGVRLLAFGAEEPQRELPLPTDAIFHYRPPQDSIRDIYSNCDAWLCGSRSEGFHLPVGEAMACRCPVVSTRVGGALDLIRNGINGFLVDRGDVDGLADNLFKLLRMHDEDWRMISDAAYETVTRYSWDDATDLFEKALRTAVDRSRNGQLAGRP